jgi:hypothetical protein
VDKSQPKPHSIMFTSKKFKSAAVMAFAFSFALATLVGCGAKKEEATEEVPTEEAAPAVVEEPAPAPADTTATDSTAAQ